MRIVDVSRYGTHKYKLILMWCCERERCGWRQQCWTQM